jgi:hypothetical protein
MKDKKRFAQIYWSLIVLGLVGYLILNGMERKKEYRKVQGKVVDQIFVAKRGKYRNTEVLRPQVSYFIDGSEYFFVDHFTARSTGSTVTVLYRKSNFRDAQIYTWLFWVDSGVIIPTLIISGFLFSLIWISLTNYGKKYVVLRGEFDIHSEGKS